MLINVILLLLLMLVVICYVFAYCSYKHIKTAYKLLNVYGNTRLRKDKEEKKKHRIFVLINNKQSVFEMQDEKSPYWFILQRKIIKLS